MEQESCAIVLEHLTETLIRTQSLEGKSMISRMPCWHGRDQFDESVGVQQWTPLLEDDACPIGGR